MEIKENPEGLSHPFLILSGLYFFIFGLFLVWGFSNNYLRVNGALHLVVILGTALFFQFHHYLLSKLAKIGLILILTVACTYFLRKIGFFWEAFGHEIDYTGLV